MFSRTVTRRKKIRIASGEGGGILNFPPPCPIGISLLSSGIKRRNQPLHEGDKNAKGEKGKTSPWSFLSCQSYLGNCKDATEEEKKLEVYIWRRKNPEVFFSAWYPKNRSLLSSKSAGIDFPLEFLYPTLPGIFPFPPEFSEEKSRRSKGNRASASPLWRILVSIFLNRHFLPACPYTKKEDAMWKISKSARATLPTPSPSN